MDASVVEMVDADQSGAPRDWGLTASDNVQSGAKRTRPTAVRADGELPLLICSDLYPRLVIG